MALAVRVRDTPGGTDEGLKACAIDCVVRMERTSKMPQVDIESWSDDHGQKCAKRLCDAAFFLGELWTRKINTRHLEFACSIMREGKAQRLAVCHLQYIS